MKTFYPILDTAALARKNCGLLTAVRAVVLGGAKLLQLRHKEHWSREFFEEARGIARLCADHQATLVINDRADFALLLNAGLHVGQDDLPAAAARTLIGPSRLLGLSTHNAEQLVEAAGAPVDYIALGPIFGTSSKQHPDPAIGLDRLCQWRGLSPVPLVAIGGITRHNARAVLAAGADSIAVIGDLLPDICTESNIRHRTEDWLEVTGSK